MKRRPITEGEYVTAVLAEADKEWLGIQPLQRLTVSVAARNMYQQCKRLGFKIVRA